MKEIRKTSQFKNDLAKVNALFEMVGLLAAGKQIPKENKPHQLKGDYKNYWECHIGDDFLLIWFDKNSNVIELVRLGSHSELYGKGRKR